MAYTFQGDVFRDSPSHRYLLYFDHPGSVTGTYSAVLEGSFHHFLFSDDPVKCHRLGLEIAKFFIFQQQI